MSRKDIVANVLKAGGVTTALRRVRGGTRVGVVAYHRIRPDDPGFETPFDDGVYIGPSESELSRQVRWLERKTRLMRTEEFLRCVETGQWPSGLCTLLTFDDAYRDNYERALPIFRQLGLDAFFFVPTRRVDERKLEWWDRISYVLKKARGTFEHGGRRFELPRERDDAIEAALESVTGGAASQAERLPERLAEELSLPLPSAEEQDREIMTWDQIREADQVISVGSHTVSHGVLSRQDRARQEIELTESRRRLQQQLDRVVDAFCYPVGGHDHFTPETEGLVQAAGYRAAFSFNTGTNHKSRVRPMDVFRVAGLGSLALLEASLVAPRLFRANRGRNR